MIRRMITAMVAVMMLASYASAAEKVSLNAEKSKINFVGSKPDGKHDGGFKKFTTEATVDLKNPSKGSLEIVIDTASLWSDNDKLTNHLKNPDFFDVRKYPKIAFKCKKIEYDEDAKKASISGVLTMLGKEVPITIPAAVAITLMIRQDFAWETLEAWQRVLAPITVTAIAWAVTTSLAGRGREFRWVVLAIGCITTAMVAMPGGDGWTDMLPLHRGWMAAIAVASLLNVWMLHKMIDRGASSWVLLVSLAGLAAPTMLAASAYGGLAEWLLGAIVTTLVFVLAVRFVVGIRPEWLAVPITLFTCSATASGRFYTYDEIPTWLYGVILLMPAMVALPDQWISKESTGKCRPRQAGSLPHFEKLSCPIGEAESLGWTSATRTRNQR